MKELTVTTSDRIKSRLAEEIEILESEVAADHILSHLDCPFRLLAFAGECEIDRTWYYIAANGPVSHPGTQVILLEK